MTTVVSAWYLTGHIGIAVPDVYAACKLFEEQGVPFVKKPNDGKIYCACYIEGHFEVKLGKLKTFMIHFLAYLFSCPFISVVFLL